MRHLSWFFNFAVRWTHWEYSSIFFYTQLEPIVHQTFFSTQEFTDWSLNNLDYILGNDKQWEGKLYKPEFKEIIEGALGDSFNNYGKVFSFGKVIPKTFNKDVVATDGINLYKADFNKLDKEDELIE